MTENLIGIEDILELPTGRPSKRIYYGTGPEQFGELRVPVGVGSYPVVILIHGGCWRTEYNLNHMSAFANALTEYGLATWSLEYRRLGDNGGGWPGTFQDVGQAVDYLRKVGKEFPLDLDKVVAVGHSAGGQLVLWLGARQKLDNITLKGKDPCVVKGLVSLAGVTDLRRAFKEGVCGDMVAELLGGTPDDLPERYIQGSPIELLPIGIPQHIVHGEQDSVVPASFGKEYCKSAEAAGDPIQLTLISGIGHFELIDPSTAAWSKVKDLILELV